MQNVCEHPHIPYDYEKYIFHRNFFLLIASISILLILFRQNRKLKSIILRQTRQLQMIDSSIEDIVDLTVGIIDIAGINSNNEKKLAMRIKACFIPRELSSTSLLHKLPALANIYRFGIIDHLKDTAPTLNSSDLEFFSLIVLGVSPAAISIACGYEHPATLYNKRLKLRKKLNIPSSDTSLEDYILSVANNLKKMHDENIETLSKNIFNK